MKALEGIHFRRAAMLALLCVAAVTARPAPAAVVAIDLGQIGFGEVRSFELLVTNTTGRYLTITNVRISCECLQVIEYPFRLPAGTTNSLFLRLTPDQEGTPEYRVDAEFAEGAFPLAEYAIGARVIPSAGPAPAALGHGIAPDLFCTVIRTPDERWYVPVEDVLQAGKVREGTTLVDVRSAERFDASHIPGALNVLLHLVKTKSFLRAGRVVLADEGWGSDRLEQECARLAETGFGSVRILAGGMNSWSRQGGPLAGARIRPARVARISPAEFMGVRGSSGWVIVNTESGEHDFGYWLPRHVTIPFDADVEAFVVELNRLAGRQRGPCRLLMVDGRGTLYDAMAPALGTIKGANVFCLDGGLAAFREYLAQLTQMRQERTATSRTQTADRRPAKPCGSCP